MNLGALGVLATPRNAGSQSRKVPSILLSCRSKYVTELMNPSTYAEPSPRRFEEGIAAESAEIAEEDYNERKNFSQ